jgi:DNA primase
MAKLTAEQRNSLGIASKRYMADVAEALPYLARRGITEATARYAKLGIVRNPILGHEPARGRLAIPYMTDAGPVAINFRCIKDHDCKVIDKHSKYWKPPGTPSALYGVQDFFTDSMTIHLTEGEFDRLILRYNLQLPTFGIPGVDVWKDSWKKVLKDFDHVVHWSDGDPAGDKMAAKLAKELGQTYKQVRLPDKTDVNSLYVDRGEEYLRSLIPK